MKTKTSKYVATNLRTKERQILDALIERVLDKYNLDEIITCFLDKINDYHDRQIIAKTVLEDELLKDDLKFELEEEFKKGRFIVTLETQEQETKLTEFICENIFPYYNQQQSALFA
jgi:hypothetical protein